MCERRSESEREREGEKEIVPRDVILFTLGMQFHLFLAQGFVPRKGYSSITAYHAGVCW